MTSCVCRKLIFEGGAQAIARRLTTSPRCRATLTRWFRKTVGSQAYPGMAMPYSVAGRWPMCGT